MFFRPVRALLLPLALFIGWAGSLPLPAAPGGPTLQFDYGSRQAHPNPVGQFMYFVPLISPDPVTVSTNTGNTQCARVTSFQCRTNGALVHVVCEFDFTGDGWQRNAFDHTNTIRHHQRQLEAGKPLARQLDAISVQGAGSGSVEMDGHLTNGQPVLTEMRLRFNRRGRTSPVSVSLLDIVLRDGKILAENEIVARVNTLTFRQKSPPKMEVTLASVKNKNAGDSLWQNFVGGIKGAAANLLLPPLGITADGQQAMLDFGQALAAQKPTFTFPLATRLKNSAVPAQ